MQSETEHHLESNSPVAETQGPDRGIKIHGSLSITKNPHWLFTLPHGK